MPKLSIILPSIRPYLLEGFYQSLLQACKLNTYELLIISPYQLPNSLKDNPNIKLFIDKGNPARALQIGLINATGDYCTTISDDSLLYPNAYDQAIAEFEKLNPPNRMLVLKFNEGSIGDHTKIGEAHFFQAWFHPEFRLNGVPKNMPVALGFIIDTKTLINVGGWDCVNYQDGNWGGHDLTLRLMKTNIVFSYMEKASYHNTWGPGPAGMYGDHIPVWKSSTMGQPVFQEMWKEPNDRLVIDINNWKQADPVWKLRFENG